MAFLRRLVDTSNNGLLFQILALMGLLVAVALDDREKGSPYYESTPAHLFPLKQHLLWTTRVLVHDLDGAYLAYLARNRLKRFVLRLFFLLT